MAKSKDLMEGASLNEAEAAARVRKINSLASKTVDANEAKLKQLETQYGSSEINVKTISSVNALVGSLATLTKGTAGTINKLARDSFGQIKSGVGEYARAVGEDINVNKQNAFGMSFAKASPLLGYFVGKFMETGIYKNMVDKMKDHMDRAISSISVKFKDLMTQGWSILQMDVKDVFKSLMGGVGKMFGKGWLWGKNKDSGRGRAEAQIEKSLSRAEQKKVDAKFNKHVEASVPHLAKGGYVGKEGLAKVHAAEAIVPLDKLFKKMKTDVFDPVTSGLKEERSNNKTFMGAFNKLQMKQEANMTRAYTADLDMGGGGKKGFFKSFRDNFADVVNRDQLPVFERIALAVTDLKTQLVGVDSPWAEAFARTMYEHPAYKAAQEGMSLLWGATTFRPFRAAVFKQRGGYQSHVKTSGEPFEIMNSSLSLIYVGTMQKFDELMEGLGISPNKPSVWSYAGKMYKNTIGNLGKGIAKVTGLEDSFMNRKFGPKSQQEIEQEKLDKIGDNFRKKKWFAKDDGTTNRAAMNGSGVSSEIMLLTRIADVLEWIKSKAERRDPTLVGEGSTEPILIPDSTRWQRIKGRIKDKARDKYTNLRDKAKSWMFDRNEGGPQPRDSRGRFTSRDSRWEKTKSKFTGAKDKTVEMLNWVKKGAKAQIKNSGFLNSIQNKLSRKAILDMLKQAGTWLLMGLSTVVTGLTSAFGGIADFFMGKGLFSGRGLAAILEGATRSLFGGAEGIGMFARLGTLLTTPVASILAGGGAAGIASVFIPVMLAGAAGLAIGTWINDKFIGPWVEERFKREDDAKNANYNSTADIMEKLKGAAGKGDARANEKYSRAANMAKDFRSSSADAIKYDHYNDYLDTTTHAVNEARMLYMAKNMNTYAQYGSDKIKTAHDIFASQKMFKKSISGMKPEVYGKEYEEAFLNWFQLNYKQDDYNISMQDQIETGLNHIKKEKTVASVVESSKATYAKGSEVASIAAAQTMETIKNSETMQMLTVAQKELTEEIKAGAINTTASMQQVSSTIVNTANSVSTVQQGADNVKEYYDPVLQKILSGEFN